MVMRYLGDLGIVIDYGLDRPGDVLQRWEAGRWQDYQPQGKPVTNPFEAETLEPGRYRLRRADP